MGWDLEGRGRGLGLVLVRTRGLFYDIDSIMIEFNDDTKGR